MCVGKFLESEQKATYSFNFRAFQCFHQTMEDADRVHKKGMKQLLLGHTSMAMNRIQFSLSKFLLCIYMGEAISTFTIFSFYTLYVIKYDINCVIKNLISFIIKLREID